MKFSPPLQTATLVQRYKRFLADVETETGELLTLHCPNTGSMKHCQPEGAAVLFSDSNNPKRKYPYTWEAVQVPRGHWVGINTARPNELVQEAIEAGLVSGLKPTGGLHREVTWQNARFDLALGDRDFPHTLIEVKNVTLGPGPDEPDDGVIAFPDAVTERGRKHLQTLIEVVRAGGRAVLFFCVQHTGARAVRPADEIDPHYGQLLREAVERGVEVLAWKTVITPELFALDEPVPIKMKEESQKTKEG